MKGLRSSFASVLFSGLLISLTALSSPAAEITPVPAGALTGDAVSVTSEEAALNFVCPNASGYCDAEYDHCENQCFDAGPNVSQECLEQCDVQFDSCYFGEPAFVTVAELDFLRFDGVVCGKYRRESFRQWDHYSVRCEFTRTERRYCRPTSQWFDLGIDDIFHTTRFCFSRPPVQFSCSPAQPNVGQFGSNELCGSNLCPL